jgi:DtxR family Mn-dependent transcriptional regulator
MKITATREDYLRAIYLLREEVANSSKVEKKVRGIDLAQYLGLAKSTVSERLKELLAAKWILENAKGDLVLSKSGDQLAHRLTYRHRIIEVFLSKTLGMASSKLHEEAHKLEHSFSDEVIGKLAHFLGNPKHCPHGKPIEVPVG